LRHPREHETGAAGPVADDHPPRMLLTLRYFGLAFSALLPVVNPLGSALIFLGLAGLAPAAEYRVTARKIAVSTVLFLIFVEFVGSALLAFLNISLPVVQVAGGLVLAAMGWRLLNEKEGDATPSQSLPASASTGSLASKIFYPFTFPVTAGPGCIVVMLTLSAHASRAGSDLPMKALAHAGIMAAVIVLSATVWLSYTYAPTLARKIAPQTVHGILRVIAFVLLCIGVQIAANGVTALFGAARP
jgi:multiple antibiotic resistance protein